MLSANNIRILSCLKLLLIQSFFVLTCAHFGSSSISNPNYKLPSAIIPTKYYLHINTLIHHNISVYNGSVAIDLTVRKPTNEIVLNAYRLREFNISLVNLDSGLKLESPQIKYEIDEHRQMLRIFWPLVPLKLKIGQQYRLTIDFVGKIQESEQFGFFKSYYKDGFNNSVPIATTQFEPNCARLAFPCFDALSLKAKFVVSITHGANYSALSNMPVDGEPVPSLTSDGPMLTTTFQTTPTMSTYLLAFALTNYVNTSVSVNGIAHRFFYPPNSKNNGSLALTNAIRAVDTFEKLLGIKYPLSKLDNFEIPKAFGRAMENWGLMSFQHKDILSNEMKYNKMQLLDVTIVQIHEIAHQWFGNLVTPESWDYVWLKEGLSSYFSFISAEMVYPNERLMEFFIVNEIDFLSTRPLDHPLTYAIKEGEDVKKTLDIVTYKLGEGFTRMLHHVIGHSTFIKGIHKYLYNFQYSTADEDDFYAAIQAAVDEDNIELFQGNQSVANVMRTWTHNQGIPTVTVIRNYDTDTITLRQKPHTKEDSKLNQKWWIPMSFATASNPDFDRTVADYIMPPEAEVTIDLKSLNISLSNSDWLIVNKQQTGIFYVVYDDLNLKMIAEALIANKDAVHHFNRALLFRDLRETFLENLDAVEPVLRLLEYLKSEDESLPWFYGLDLMFELVAELEDSNVLGKFINFLFDQYIGIFDRKYQNGELSTATDLKTKGRMRKFNFNIGSPRCQNFTTTDMASEFFLLGNVEGSMTPCKMALCDAIQNATLDEFKAYFMRTAAFVTDSADWYEFQTTLRCVNSPKIFRFMWDVLDNDSSSVQLQQFCAVGMDKMFSTNKYFKSWIAIMTHMGMRNDETVDKNDVEIGNFTKKYEANIDSWLEGYSARVNFLTT